MRFECLFIGFLFLPFLGVSQEPSFRSITIEDGLPSSTIYDISQRENGKIVIGHERGLSAYNGMEVMNFRNESKTTPLSNLTVFNEHVIARNFVNELFILKDDSSVNQWNNFSETDAGLCKLLEYNGRLFRKNHHSILEIELDEHQHGESVVLHSTEGFFDIHVLRDTMYVLSSCGMRRFPIDRPNQMEELNISLGKKPTLIELDNRMSVFCPEFGHIMVDPFSDTNQRITFSQFNAGDKVTSVKHTSNNRILIGTYSGLYIYNRQGELLQQCYKDVQISCIFQDLESNIWLGTLHDGIRIITNLEIQTIKVNENISKLISADDSNLTLGTFEGNVYHFNQSLGLELLYSFNQNNEIQSIYQDAHSLWTFCSDLVELELRPAQMVKTFQTYPVKAIVKLRDTIYCATSKGVQLVVDERVLPAIRSELWVKQVVVKNNRVLFETSAGIMRFHQGNLLPEKFQFALDQLELTDASTLVESNGSIFFALNNNVYKVDERNEVSKFDCSSGLAFITSLAVARDNIFVSDGKIIYAITPEKQFVIDAAKGLQVPEIIDIVGWGDHLVVVGKDQFQLFPSKAMNTQPYIQTLAFTGVYGTFSNKESRFVSDYSGNHLMMQFEYLPNISSAGMGAVFYRLTGVVDEWKTMEYKSGGYQIDEQRLPIGKHSLEVYAVDGSKFETKIQQFQLYVAPPFYFTWWFFLLLFVLVSLVIWRIYHHRIFLLNRKNEQQMESEQLKTKAIRSELKALRSQMNPHFIFNSLSSIQSKILNDKSKDAYTSLSSFSKLLRQSLKFTSQEFITLENEIDFLNNYISMEQERMDGGFQSSVVLDPNIDPKKALFPSLFSQPFVENAIRHGLAHSAETKTLSIKVKGVTTGYDFIIEDNGVGRAAANEINQIKRQSHESFATNAMEERIQLINANGNVRVELKIEDQLRGTRVIISIHINA